MGIMNGHDVGYVRVSSFSQNTGRQLDGINLTKTFEKMASAKDAKRPVLQECVSYLREGDTLHVHSINRSSCPQSDRPTDHCGDLKRQRCFRHLP